MRYENRTQRRYGSGVTPDSTDAEFAGRVDSIGPEPQFLTGRVPALQTLGVTVTDVRRGAGVSVGDSVDLDVLIVRGNPHVSPGASGVPALDSSMIQPGVLLVAWANRTDGRWQALEISSDGPSSANTYAGRHRYRR